jgi:hypothetical protein
MALVHGAPLLRQALLQTLLRAALFLRQALVRTVLLLGALAVEVGDEGLEHVEHAGVHGGERRRRRLLLGSRGGLRRGRAGEARGKHAVGRVVASSATVAGQEVGVVALGNAGSDGHLEAGLYPVDGGVPSASRPSVHVVRPNSLQFTDVDASDGQTFVLVE